MIPQFDPKRLSCPLCNCADIHPHYRINASIPFTTERCENCGFIFMNPPLSDETICSLYDDSYYTGDTGFTYFDERRQERFCSYVWKARLKTIRRYVKHGSHLDIGSSFGLFLKYSSKYFQTQGIELSPYASGWSRDHTPSEIHTGTVETFTADKQFSVITLIEVIEHIKNPKPFIERIFSLTAPKGVAVIQTADMNAWQAVNAGEGYHYFLPGHLSYFSEDNLTKALIAAGFSHVTVFRPVDFPLIAKLKKSRGSFRSWKDYLRWFDIAKYHLKGYFKRNGRPLTSSMVIYAFKD